MCELLAMSSLEPATLSISLNELARHGGLTGPHKDGWGVAYYAGPDVRLVREADAASESGGIRYIRDQAYRSNMVLAHIRQATLGAVEIKNTQPFVRELGGRMHVFAHNGDVPGMVEDPAAPLGFHRPVGETDSEYAFCALLAHLEHLWRRPHPPPERERLAVVLAFAALLRRHGPANFLYADSELLFVHGDRRTQEDGRMAPPGLHTLCRTCPSRSGQVRPAPIEGLAIGLSLKNQRVLLVASVPLTPERWEPVGEGEVLVIAEGQVRARVRS